MPAEGVTGRHDHRRHIDLVGHVRRAATWHPETLRRIINRLAR
jgi:hypothetical protein